MYCKAVKTDKNIDHSTISKADVIVNRVELAVKRHFFVANGALWFGHLLKKNRIASNLVAGAYRWWRPSEFWEGCGFV